MLRIVAAGEVLWDAFPTGQVLGGAPLNFAYRVENLGHRGLVASAVGSDAAGEALLGAMRSLALDPVLVQVDPVHATGRVDIQFDPEKNPTYAIAAGVAYEHLSVSPELLAAVAGADCFCFSTLAQRNPVFRATIDAVLAEAPRDVLFDVNLRQGCYEHTTILRSLRRCSLVKMNEQEAAEVGELVVGRPIAIADVPVALLDRYPRLRCCVVTLGPSGCLAVDASGEAVYSPGFAVELVDPCGAGDSFEAGFLCALLSGEGLEAACELGNALGALTAAQNGATTAISLDAVRQLLSTGARVVSPGHEAVRNAGGASAMSSQKKRMSFREVFGNLNYTDDEVMRYPDVAPKAPAVWPPREDAPAASEVPSGRDRPSGT